MYSAISNIWFQFENYLAFHNNYHKDNIFKFFNIFKIYSFITLNVFDIKSEFPKVSNVSQKILTVD